MSVLGFNQEQIKASPRSSSNSWQILQASLLIINPHQECQGSNSANDSLYTS